MTQLQHPGIFTIFDARTTPADLLYFMVKYIKGIEMHNKAFDFFKLFRDRAAGGYYSTPEGWKAIGYVGNLPMAEFLGPPSEVLKHLGLA